jgi:uroporphyrinogen decarboxylase
MNMNAWLSEMIASSKKKAIPLLSFPGVQLLGVGVLDLVRDSELQAEGMRLVAARTPAAAAVSMMDLSIEAECFGSDIRYFDDEVPTVVGALVSSMQEAQALVVPPVGIKRTDTNIRAIQKAAGLIGDRPVFAGVIGRFRWREG